MTTLVAERSADPLALAVNQCRQEQVVWAQRPVKERLRPVYQFRRLLVAECDRVCTAIIDDVGKVEAEALGEVLSVAEACRFLEKRAAGLLAPRKVGGRPFWLRGQSDRVHRRPRGVVGIIGTWNYPLFLSGIQIVQALSAGNAVVWKPSELARSTGEVMADLLRRAGYPSGLFHVMEPTREGGPLLVESAIDHLVFTGSAATGRAIARRLGERLISSTLELSGCDAQLVLADADAKLAATAAWFGSTLNRGQTCIGVRRALVHRSLYDQFVDTLRPWAEAAGPMRLVLPAQAAQLERLVADAVDRGGRVLAERLPAGAGEARPAVVLDAHPDMALWQEATFAPLLAVAPFAEVEEALRMESACPYALGASIFTASPDQAEAVAGRLRSGSVCVNDVVMPTAHPGACFGGTAASGWGTTRGAEGLLEMTVPQVVHSKKADSFRPHYAAATGQGTDQAGLLRAVLSFSHGLSLGQRWRGFKQMLRALWKG